jgi:hypothetical protein
MKGESDGTSVGTAREAIGEARCAGFMFMGRLNGINLYKHGIRRTSLYLDNDSPCYLPGRSGSFIRADWDTELRKLEACLMNLGWTLTTPYDEDFIAQKQHALRERGISLLTITVGPQVTNIH